MAETGRNKKGNKVKSKEKALPAKVLAAQEDEASFAKSVLRSCKEVFKNYGDNQWDEMEVEGRPGRQWITMKKKDWAISIIIIY